MANRLAQETSPYLLQHAENPVDWYPWGEEAFARARAEDRPILLSIGYSACHWCHVMEHESFENPQIAALMNERFVSIKVDREERPDLDAMYMQAVQAITGSGGWPMTVFLTPDGTPFYGGTYYPPQDRGGRPGFPRVLISVSDAYRDRRDDILRSGNELVEHLKRADELQPSDEPLTAGLLHRAFTALSAQFDAQNGGFGTAPKFPQPMALDFLLRYHQRTGSASALQMVEQTLTHMAAGGIYDQLGGGFHRYSTDAIWLVPHFEKMLYDNAQLVRVLVNAYQITRRPLYRRIAEETLAYVLREMTSPEGGFYSTQDADSEGEEGKFFVWTPEEILDCLGPDDGPLVAACFGVRAQGNFEAKNILHVPMSLTDAAERLSVSPEGLEEAVERGRRALLARRERRIRPGLDDKVVTSWNGLMLRAFAEAGRALGRDDFVQTAAKNAAFLQESLWRDGKLLRTYRSGRSKGAAYLEDYACLANGLLSLYEATFDLRWFEWARDLAQIVIDQFGDRERGGFFDTGTEHETLILRPQDLYDNAMPSGNSAASEALLRLSALTGDADEERWALSVPRLLLPALERYPAAFGHLLCAVELAVGERKEVAVVGRLGSPDTEILRRAVFEDYRPSLAVAGADSGEVRAGEVVPLLAGRVSGGDTALAYVCQNFACQMPVSDPDELRRQLAAPI